MGCDVEARPSRPPALAPRPQLPPQVAAGGRYAKYYKAWQGGPVSTA